MKFVPLISIEEGFRKMTYIDVFKLLNVQRRLSKCLKFQMHDTGNEIF